MQGVAVAGGGDCQTFPLKFQRVSMSAYIIALGNTWKMPALQTKTKVLGGWVVKMVCG